MPREGDALPDDHAKALNPQRYNMLLLTSVLDLLSTANVLRVLASLQRLGGRSRFTPLRNAAGVGDQQLSRALAFLNARGFVGARVLAEGDRAPMEYFLSVHGKEALDAVRAMRTGLNKARSPLAAAAQEEITALVGE